MAEHLHVALENHLIKKITGEAQLQVIFTHSFTSSTASVYGVALYAELGKVEVPWETLRWLGQPQLRRN